MMTSIFLPGVILQIGVTPDFPWLLAAGDSAAPPTPSNRSLLLDCDGSALGAL
jgi:hypothetical protein